MTLLGGSPFFHVNGPLVEEIINKGGGQVIRAGIAKEYSNFKEYLLMERDEGGGEGKHRRGRSSVEGWGHMETGV